MRISSTLITTFLLVLGTGALHAQESMKAMDGMKSMAAAAPEATQHMKSITYRTKDGGEVVRYFQIDTNKEGVKRLQEVNRPGIETTKPIPTSSETPWLMAALGFEKYQEGTTAEKILGPDKKPYAAKSATSAAAGPGPNGEAITRVDYWTKPANSAWVQTSASSSAKQTPTAEEAENSWKAAPKPPTKNEKKVANAAPSDDGMKSGMMNSSGTPPAKKQVSAAEKERQRKLQELSNKQRRERLKEEEMKRKKELAKKRKEAAKKSR